MAIAGKLTGSDGGYAHHVVEVSAEFALTDGKQTTRLLLRDNVADDGRFQIEIPEGASISESNLAAQWVVRGPDGRRLLETTVSLDQQPIELVVKAQP